MHSALFDTYMSDIKYIFVYNIVQILGKMASPSHV